MIIEFIGGKKKGFDVRIIKLRRARACCKCNLIIDRGTVVFCEDNKSYHLNCSENRRKELQKQGFLFKEMK